MPTSKVVELQDRLQAHGYRLTKARQAVLEVLVFRSAHLNATQIHHQARGKYQKLGLVTVYRTLALLHQLGLVQRVHLEDGCHSFVRIDSPQRGRHHHQLICEGCGRVEQFPNCELPLQELAAHTGFEINQHRVEVLGLCPGCRGQRTAFGRTE